MSQGKGWDKNSTYEYNVDSIIWIPIWLTNVQYESKVGFMEKQILQQISVVHL